MTIWWIGQRVKKVRGVYPENIGATGTVVGLEFLPADTVFNGVQLGFAADIQVMFDRDMKSKYTREIWLGNTLIHTEERAEILPAGMTLPEKRANLEPILPEGLEADEVIEALFEPEDAVA